MHKILIKGASGMNHSKTFDHGAAVAAMLDAAKPPREMAAAPVAPARGAKQLVAEYELLPGGTRRYLGSHWVDADVFTSMCRDAYIRHVKAAGNDAAFCEPFTPGQMAVARRYRDLAERHAAGGMKCASLEARGGGGSGQGGDFMDAYLAEGRELSMIQRRIGTGQAMALRRIRPSVRGSKAAIMDRRLVDMVCIEGADLSAVLRAHGWSVDGKNRSVLRVALAAALDRMQGYRDPHEKGA